MWHLFWILAASGLRLSHGSIKRWLPDTDWHNRRNWRNEQLPCSASEVLLPEDAVVSIYVNGSVSWKTLILPDSGELILDDDWRLLDPSEEEEPCQIRQAVFLNWHPRSWFHPDHWSIVDENQQDALESMRAVPHSDRIPCVTDEVLLPDGHGFSVDWHRIRWPLTVGALKLGQEVIRSAGDLLAAPELKYRVHNPPASFFINGTDCNDPLGCPCGNAAPNVMQLICSNSAQLCADSLQCADWFRPSGHCCPMCGALFTLTLDEQIFNKNSLDRLVASMAGPAVSTYSSRTDRNILQLTVTDNSTNELSLRLAARIFDYLKDESNRKMYGLVAVDVKRSGVSHAAAVPWSSEQLRWLVTNLMTALCVGLLLALAAAVWHLKQRGRTSAELMDRLVSAVRGSHPQPAVAFARFQNDGNSVQIGIPDSILFQDPPSLASLGPAAASQCSQPTPQDAADQAKEVDRDAAAAESAPESAPAKTGAAEIESAESSDPAVKRPGPWKKLTRAFVNPLFGNPSASGRLSGRWSMSSLIKSSATQENPIFDVAGGQPPDDQTLIAAAQSASDHSVDKEMDALERPPAADSHVGAAPADAQPQVEPWPEEESPEWRKAPLKPPRQLATFWSKAKRQPAESKECADESAARQPEDEIQLTLAEETQDADSA